MVVIALKGGRRTMDSLECLANIHATRNRQRDQTNAKTAFLLFGHDAEARARCKAQRYGIGIGRDQFALANRLAVRVAVENGGVSADQRSKASKSIILKVPRGSVYDVKVGVDLIQVDRPH